MEPFAGGAIVGLTAVFEGLVHTTKLFELEPGVAAVWQTILNGQARWLGDRISEFDMSLDSVRRVLGSRPPSVREFAFQTILRNRVQRGGIMAAGAGFMKKGENGRGLASRWYPQTLRKRVMAIGQMRSRIVFQRADGLHAFRCNAHRPDAAFFIDPPYTVAAGDSTPTRQSIMRSSFVLRRPSGATS
jgi:DNA adenine methylase